MSWAHLFFHRSDIPFCGSWLGFLTCLGVSGLQVWDGLSRAPGPSSTWSLVLQQPKLVHRSCRVPPMWVRAPKAPWGLRTGPLLSLLHSPGRSKSPGQPRLKEQRNRSHILVGKATKSHCKNRVENCSCICNKSTTVFIVGAREVSLRDLRGADSGWKQHSGNHGPSSDALTKNARNTILIEKGTLHCILLWQSHLEDESTFK